MTMRVFTFPIGVGDFLGKSYWTKDGDDFVLHSGADEKPDTEVARITPADVPDVAARSSDHARWVMFCTQSDGRSVWQSIYPATLPDRISVREYFSRQTGISHALAQVFIPIVGQDPILVLCGAADPATFSSLSGVEPLPAGDLSTVLDQMPGLSVEQVEVEGSGVTLCTTVCQKDGTPMTVSGVEIYWSTTGGVLSANRTTTTNGTAHSSLTLFDQTQQVKVKVGFRDYPGVAEVIIK